MISDTQILNENISEKEVEDNVITKMRQIKLLPRTNQRMLVLLKKNQITVII